MKFKFCYEKIFEKTIHEKIDLLIKHKMKLS